jgi:hypothetical protein
VSIAAPYIQTMAKEYQLPDGGVDLKTPEIRNALNRRDAQGQPQAMSLSEFQTSLRGAPQWRQTQGAFDSTMAVGGQVLKDMGLL